MSILNNSSSSVEDEIKKHQDGIRMLSVILKNRYRQLGNQFWKNPKFSPIIMAENYGQEQLKEVFYLSKELAEFIYKISGEVINIIPENYEVSQDINGNITITEKSLNNPETINEKEIENQE